MNSNPSSKEKPNINQVYTLEDLKSWPYSGTALAVVGHPVAHSLSPIMHTAALDELRQRTGTLQDWYYVKFDIPPEQLPKALEHFHQAGFEGLNLTVPHKTIALDHIQISQNMVSEAGASNTLKRTPEGYEGFNTDADGLVEGIRHSLGIDVRDYSVLLLGAGGAARSATAQCLHLGVPHLYLANRSQDRLQALLDDISTIKTTSTISTHSLPDAITPDTDHPIIVINATSLGLKPSDPSPVRLNNIPTGSFAYDMIYSPAETTFLKEAKKQGMHCANGLSMLVYQGLRSLALWTGEEPSA